MLYIILALIMFGLLIAVHEFGHFAAAKLFGIQVNEFSIGMGPALLKKQIGDTLYSLRLFPVGGYCAMEGEDEEVSSDNPRAFGNAAGWKQAIVLVAGAFMNFLTGLLIVLILYAGAAGFRVPTYGGPLEGYGTENCGLQEGDRILSVDGHAILVYSNVSLYLSRAGDDVDFVVERDGERLELNNVHIPYQERTDEEGTYTRLRGISIGYAPPSGISSCTPGTPPLTMCAWFGSAWGIWSPERWACGTCPDRWALWTPCPRWAAPPLRRRTRPIT